MHQISLKLVHKNIVSVCFYCLVRRRRKIRRKSNEFQGLVSQELLGLFLSNRCLKKAIEKGEVKLSSQSHVASHVLI